MNNLAAIFVFHHNVEAPVHEVGELSFRVRITLQLLEFFVC